jgi:hypothetical protein
MSLLKRQREGYLLVDNTNSPGLPDEVVQRHLRMGLPAPLTARSGRKVESATITCCHCNVIVILNPNRKRQRGYCWHCDHYVCDNPVCNLQCTPFQKTLDDLHHLAQCGLALPAIS